MAIPGFFDENSDRDYPFVYGQDMTGQTENSGSFELPKGLIVDFSCDFGPKVPFSASDRVYLTKISRLGGLFDLEFASTALPNHKLVFQFEQGDAEFTTRDAVATTDSPDPTCDDDYAWYGYLTIGRILPMLDLLGSPDSWTPNAASGIEIEPALLRSKKNQYVDAITVGNFDRTRFVPPPECSLSASSTDPTAIFISAACLRGEITFKEGYNCSIRVSPTDNSMTISAIVGAGEGEPCDEIPLYEGEQPPAGSPFLSGGEPCKDLITAINGLSEEQIFLVTTPGLDVVQTGDHELTIRLTGDGLDIG